MAGIVDCPVFAGLSNGLNASQITKMQSAAEKDRNHIGPLFGVLVGMMIIVLACPFNIFSETPHPAAPVAGVDSVG
ncbi:MAG: hypothetical protein K2I02_04865, partial [Duncaniella sp.]|nr:hypothetical protein [Duncaniella sp.]